MLFDREGLEPASVLLSLNAWQSRPKVRLDPATVERAWPGCSCMSIMPTRSMPVWLASDAPLSARSRSHRGQPDPPIPQSALSSSAPGVGGAPLERRLLLCFTFLSSTSSCRRPCRSLTPGAQALATQTAVRHSCIDSRSNFISRTLHHRHHVHHHSHDLYLSPSIAQSVACAALRSSPNTHSQTHTHTHTHLGTSTQTSTGSASRPQRTCGSLSHHHRTHHHELVPASRRRPLPSPPPRSQRPSSRTHHRRSIQPPPLHPPRRPARFPELASRTGLEGPSRLSAPREEGMAFGPRQKAQGVLPIPVRSLAIVFVHTAADSFSRNHQQ